MAVVTPPSQFPTRPVMIPRRRSALLECARRRNAGIIEDAIDSAIDTLALNRASIGGAQTRLVITMNNLSVAHETLSAANSRIRDVDIAEETAAMTRNQILSQAGTSVLAQANQLPSAALSLLG